MAGKSHSTDTGADIDQRRRALDEQARGARALIRPVESTIPGIERNRLPTRPAAPAADPDDLRLGGTMVEQARKPPTSAAPVSSSTRDPLVVRVQHLVTGVILVNVQGSIDSLTAADLQLTLVDAARSTQGQPPRLLLDLSGVTFLDHIGLDALLHVQDRWGAASGTVELLAPSPSVVRLLHEANLDGESWMRTLHEAPQDHQPF